MQNEKGLKIHRVYSDFWNKWDIYSQSEAKNAYFLSGEATNEIYFFSLHEMK